MQLTEFVKLDMDGVRKIALAVNREQAEHYADERLVDYAARAMRCKLDDAREQGRGGWWNEDECSIDYLRDLLVETLTKGDMVDVMNFAAMIYARECADA